MTLALIETRDMQTLMDSAYDKWQARGDLDKDMRFSIMTNPEKVAVLFGNLNYQVENGGFQQWIDNRYATPAALRALRSALEGSRELNPAVYDKLVELLDTVEPVALRWKEIEGYFDDAEWEETVSELDTLDKAYYAMKEAPLAFFQSLLNGYDAQRDPFTVYR